MERCHELLVGEGGLFIFLLDEGFEPLFGGVMGNGIRAGVREKVPEWKNAAGAGDDFFFHSAGDGGFVEGEFFG